VNRETYECDDIIITLNGSDRVQRYVVETACKRRATDLVGVIFAAEATEKLRVSMFHIKHQLEANDQRSSWAGEAVNTCLDCSSVISSDAFIPLSVINLRMALKGT